MDVKEAIGSRNSNRAFTNKAVDKDTIKSIIELATRAPSWSNSQPWEIFVAGGEVLNKIREEYLANFDKGVSAKPDMAKPAKWPERHKNRGKESYLARMDFIGKDPNDKEVDREVDRNNFRFFGAPSVIYLCMDKELSSWSLFDLGLLAENIMLTAKSYGLETTPAYNLVSYPEILRQNLEIPKNLLIVMGIAIGYSDEDLLNKFKSPRRPVDEVLNIKGL